MIHPYPHKIRLLGRVESPDGPAMLLSCDTQWVIAYPDDIDSSDREAIDSLHATYMFPRDGKLLPREQMPHSVPLFGYDILHFWQHQAKHPRLTPASMLQLIFGEKAPCAANSAEIIQLSLYRANH